MAEKRIPSFDGTPEKLQTYREDVLQYLMAVEMHKRYLVGPRLVQELSGIAKVLVRTKTLKDPQWLSHARGAYELLRFLEDNLERPGLQDANSHVTSFFYNLERRKGESMTSWVARHSEKLWEASKSIQRVQREQGLCGKGIQEPRNPNWQQWQQGTWEVSSQQTGSGPFRDDGRLEEDSEDPESSAAWQGWRRASWTWSGSGEGWSWSSPEYEPPQEWGYSDEPFIPEFLAGFLLLHRSGLDPAEKSNILATIKWQFTTQAVARALREQWSDSDLAKRDRSKTGNALLEESEWEDDEALMSEMTESELALLGEEEQEAYRCEQKVAEEALEAIHAQKATLREARWKQRQIKLGRKFFPPKPFQRSSSSSQGNRSDGCFKCGGPHKQRDCPQIRKPKEALVNEEAAEIAFTTYEENPSAESALFGSCEKGDSNLGRFGIIDSGATASLGSVDAMEAWREANVAESGASQMTIDPTRRPVFKFGNGQRKECMSTVSVGIGAGDKKGSFEVHVHDTPNQPVLVSRKALRSLGAIVDFANNTAIYTKVDPYVTVDLNEASNGHLLMPLTGNLLEGGRRRSTPLTSLAE